MPILLWQSRDSVRITVHINGDSYFGHIALCKASSHLWFLLFWAYSSFLRGQPPLMKFNWAYRPISRLEPPVKRWLRTDNYRICPIAYDKSYNAGWLNAWNQAMSPKPFNCRWLSYWKRAICPKQQLALIGSRGNKALYVLEVSTATVLGIGSRGILP